jgi:phosphohistidine phosphatase
MLTLTLIRHAKSFWDDSEINDFDRPLSKRGYRDAPKMAWALAKMGCRPARILTSPSKRTLQTLDCFIQTGTFSADKIQTVASIYEAGSGDLLDLLASQNSQTNSLALVGHNPGLTDLVRILSGVNVINLPTCGIVTLRSTSDSWSDIRDINFKLLLLLTPKGIAGDIQS